MARLWSWDTSKFTKKFPGWLDPRTLRNLKFKLHQSLPSFFKRYQKIFPLTLNIVWCHYSFNSFYSYYWHYFGLLNIGIIIGLSWTNFLWVIDNLYIFLRVKNEQKQFLLIWIYFTELTFYWHSFFEKTFSQISNLTIWSGTEITSNRRFRFQTSYQ